MAIVNGNYAKLQDSYLFTDIAKRVAAFTAAHPEKKIIKMGIGDVTLPLAPCVVDAMKKAVEELGHKETFRGYGPEQGYEFLHEAIQKYYARHGVKLDTKDIFISDGAKSDCGNITDLFEDMAAEQKARTTYDNILRLVKDPEVCEPIRFLRQREIVHFQRFGEGLRLVQEELDSKNFYMCNPEFDLGCGK